MLQKLRVRDIFFENFKSFLIEIYSETRVNYYLNKYLSEYTSLRELFASLAPIDEPSEVFKKLNIRNVKRLGTIFCYCY